MLILHDNAETEALHRLLAEQGHHNVIVPVTESPFVLADDRAMDAAFIGLYPHGMRLMERLHRRNPDCLVVMTAATEERQQALDAMRRGAFGYLLRPFDATEIERVVIAMTRTWSLQQRQTTLEEPHARSQGLARWLGSDEAAPYGKVRDEMERELLERALGRYQGNISQAARALGISRTTFYAKVRKLHIALPRDKVSKSQS